MQEADVDNSGTIDYGEFVAATLHLNKIEKEDHLFGAFSYFDKDGSGHVNAHELQQACDEFGINAPLEELIQDVDQDNASVYKHSKSRLHRCSATHNHHHRQVAALNHYPSTSQSSAHSLYPVVSEASIVAKVTRDHALQN
ncbi:putative non-specific serine/threonine protein kinase [Helianthus annuus]|nr:putative non-specific serine/threonine protein kinase [Helianthus annuus]